MAPTIGSTSVWDGDTEETKPVFISGRGYGRGIAYIPITKGKLTGSALINGEEVNTKMLGFNVTRRATVGVDTAIVTLANAKEEWTGKWTGGEVVKIYMDYSTGTTQIFEGRVTKTVSSYAKFPQLEISASDYGQEAMGVLVFKKYTTATDIGQIVVDLVSAYLPSHTTANVNISTGITATPEWQGKKLWDCVKELIRTYGSNNYEFYVDFAKDWHFFKIGTRVHEKEDGIASVFGQNMLSMELDDPFTIKKNKITVIGNSVDGVPIISTAEDLSDQSKYWVMQEIINDNNLTTQAEVDNKAAKILARKLNPGNTGRMVTDGLPGAMPGYKIMTFEPGAGINGFVTISEVKHVLSGKSYRTEIQFYEVEPEPDTIVKIAETVVKNEQESLGLDNENGMENTYTFTFDNETNIQTHSGTELSRGSLIVSPGSNVGTMTTDTLVVAKNITKAFIKINGNNIKDVQFKISNTGGSSYSTVEPNTLIIFTAPGKHLKLKTTLASPDIEIKSLSIMYK